MKDATNCDLYIKIYADLVELGMGYISALMSCIFHSAYYTTVICFSGWNAVFVP